MAANDTSGQRINLKVFGILVAGGVVSSWASLPYVLSFTTSLPVPFWQLLLLVTIQALVQVSLATGLGLWLGRQLGLGVPILKGWLAGEYSAARQFRTFLPLASGAGVVVGAIVLLLEKLVFVPLLPTAFHQIPTPTPWEGFLAAFSGGITEELICRLGVMTLLVWLGTKLTHLRRPNRSIVWVAIALTALLFGVLHLPLTAHLMPLTPLVVARVLLLNGIAGCLFGWLYWQKGLEAAMVAHFSCDMVVHVIAAAPFMQR